MLERKVSFPVSAHRWSALDLSGMLDRFTDVPFLVQVESACISLSLFTVSGSWSSFQCILVGGSCPFTYMSDRC